METNSWLLLCLGSKGSFLTQSLVWSWSGPSAARGPLPTPPSLFSAPVSDFPAAPQVCGESSNFIAWKHFLFLMHRLPSAWHLPSSSSSLLDSTRKYFLGNLPWCHMENPSFVIIYDPMCLSFYSSFLIIISYSVMWLSHECRCPYEMLSPKKAGTVSFWPTVV